MLTCELQKEEKWDATLGRRGGRYRLGSMVWRRRHTQTTCWVSEAAVFLLSIVPVTLTAGSVVQEQSIDQKQSRTIKGVTSSYMAGSPRARRWSSTSTISRNIYSHISILCLYSHLQVMPGGCHLI